MMSRFYSYKCWALPYCTSTFEWFYSWFKVLLNTNKCPGTVYIKIKEIHKQGKLTQCNCTEVHSLLRPTGGFWGTGKAASALVVLCCIACSSTNAKLCHDVWKQESVLLSFDASLLSCLHITLVFPELYTENGVHIPGVFLNQSFSIHAAVSLWQKVFPLNLLCIFPLLNYCHSSSARADYWQKGISLWVENVTSTKK